MIPELWAGECQMKFDQALTVQNGVVACGYMGIVSLGTLMFGIAIFSWRRRVPISVGVVRAMHGLALPIIAVGLVLWLPLLFATARFEDRASAELRAEVQHEGKVLAARKGKLWPGMTPMCEHHTIPNSSHNLL